MFAHISALCRPRVSGARTPRPTSMRSLLGRWPSRQTDRFASAGEMARALQAVTSTASGHGGGVRPRPSRRAPPRCRPGRPDRLPSPPGRRPSPPRHAGRADAAPRPSRPAPAAEPTRPRRSPRAQPRRRPSPPRLAERGGAIGRAIAAWPWRRPWPLQACCSCSGATRTRPPRRLPSATARRQTSRPARSRRSRSAPEPTAWRPAPARSGWPTRTTTWSRRSIPRPATSSAASAWAASPTASPWAKAPSG